MSRSLGPRSLDATCQTSRPMTRAAPLMLTLWSTNAFTNQRLHLLGEQLSMMMLIINRRLGTAPRDSF